MDQHCDYADCAKPVVADIEALIVEGTRRCSAWIAQDDVIIDLIRFTLNCDSILGEDFEITFHNGGLCDRGRTCAAAPTHKIWAIGERLLERMMRIIIAGFAGWLAAIGGAVAQDAVPTEMMLRTWFIHPKGGKEAGSAFTLDYKGRIYLITARHVVEGVPATDAELEVRRSQADAWTDYHTMRTLYPSSADVDIAVFETGETVPQPYTITPGGRNDSDHDGMTFGQVVWFIGYPFGLSSLTQPGGPIPITSLPFAKRGSISAVDASHPDAVIDYIDGFNNKGFSGGPVVYWAFGSRSYKILSVVKGYRNEAAEMNLNGQMVDTNIMVNSGILVSYSITHAIDAIEKSLLSTK